LRNVDTDEIITVKSRGSEGLFFLFDISGTYRIGELKYEIKGGRSWTTLYYTANIPLTIKIEEGAVNNIGDIHWTESFETITEKDGSTTYGDSKQDCRCLRNHDEVKEWFRMTYPDSDWNTKKWSNV